MKVFSEQLRNFGEDEVHNGCENYC
eukprot:COSAG01_NODE_56548_length_317_cov_2.211009_1_plen_24_part_01